MAETVQNSELSRFEITADGELAGFTQYVDTETQRIFFHTEIGEEFGGQGLAGSLVTTALDETAQAGLRVVAVCPYVAKFIERHPNYQNNADPVTDDALALAQKAAQGS